MKTSVTAQLNYYWRMLHRLDRRLQPLCLQNNQLLEIGASGTFNADITYTCQRLMELLEL